MVAMAQERDTAKGRLGRDEIGLQCTRKEEGKMPKNNVIHTRRCILLW